MARDITILIMTTGREPRLIPALRQWLKTCPSQIIVTTIKSVEVRLRSELATLEDDRVLCQSVPSASAREQLVAGLQAVRTDLLLITDDRTYPSPRTLSLVARCFSDPRVGALTIGREIVAAPGKRLSSWEAFGALNQIRRRILHSALAYFHDGQVLNLSGGITGARTSILCSEDYYHALQTEKSFGRYKLTLGKTILARDL
jgi:cellulose synthase/poly-beta-1,6-N-acetylglucosamine synthase-like glycosyltransferase